MDNAIYATLSRQSGLMDELQVLANNIANASTRGFRREEVVFAEHVARLDRGDPSLSVATALGRRIDLSEGGLSRTGSPFDLAIEGEGFFQVETPQGLRLTRAGAFTPNEVGDLVTPDGYPVLDAGGGTIFVPPDAGEIAVGRDGTVSAGGLPVGQIGVVVPEDANSLQRRGANLFEAPAVAPVEAPRVLQGFVEGSNVNAVAEIGRLIEVQHAYEQGQKFLDQENERIRSVIQMLAR